MIKKHKLGDLEMYNLTVNKDTLQLIINALYHCSQDEWIKNFDSKVSDEFFDCFHMLDRKKDEADQNIESLVITKEDLKKLDLNRNGIIVLKQDPTTYSFKINGIRHKYTSVSNILTYELIVQMAFGPKATNPTTSYTLRRANGYRVSGSLIPGEHIDLTDCTDLDIDCTYTNNA